MAFRWNLSPTGKANDFNVYEYLQGTGILQAASLTSVKALSPYETALHGSLCRVICHPRSQP